MNKWKPEFYSEQTLESACAGERRRSGPAGLFIHPKGSQKLVIGLEKSSLEEPAAFLATICHELGPIHLLGARRIGADAAGLRTAD